MRCFGSFCTRSYVGQLRRHLSFGQVRFSSEVSRPHLLYNHEELESKWYKIWNTTDKITDSSLRGTDKPKFYVLSMFPYPSGYLHMGHVRVYTISDTLARFRRMSGYEVIHPMGWDAFGLPAENAAIERGIEPSEWTKKNISVMKHQLKSLGTQFDWDREVTTCDPDYYKWTQFIFLKMYQAGLAYREEAVINWDPVDQTVLANEQVDAEGRSWRSGAIVEKRTLKQWFLRTTEFAEELLNDLDKLKWPDRVVQMQKNWIGKSTGMEIEFKLECPKPNLNSIKVFTSRPDTVFGVTYLVVGPDHPIISSGATAPSVLKTAAKFRLEQFKNPQNLKKSGVPLNMSVIHPLTKEKIPLYLGNYVVNDYGTGAVMAVPAHDVRDWEFAEFNRIYYDDNRNFAKFVVGEAERDAPYADYGTLNANCGEFSGLSSEKAIEAIINDGEIKGYGKRKVNYRLRDWLISRQRYWGAPIPIVHCPTCKTVPVPESELPVLLPNSVKFTGKGGSPLSDVPEFANVDCPKCGGPARRETDTMDTFVDSSWYFLRYLDPRNSSLPFKSDVASKSMPVDVYIGGIEHAILHLLYARFFTKFLSKNNFVNLPNGEPFRELITQGMVHGRTFRDPHNGRYLKPEELDFKEPSNPIQKSTGLPPAISYEKMSKSKYNGVDPTDIVKQYGADVTRLYILHKAPPEEVLEWDDQAIVGMSRFLNRVWQIVDSAVKAAGGRSKEVSNDHKFDLKGLSKEEKDLYRETNQAIKDVTTAMNTSYSFNTSISALIKLSHSITSFPSVTSAVHTHSVQTLVKLLSPMAPVISEELWSKLGGYTVDRQSCVMNSVHSQSWPELNLHGLRADEKTVVFQVNGKKRGTICVPTSENIDQEFLETAVKQSDAGKKWLLGKNIRKVVVARTGNLINFVVEK
ncbi:leucyl-tRNA synthetase [Paraphysoderma sedebokerense]|nr:leucyl-tRNA synthetase [Paraphysoderma sedebokerense]